MKTINVKGKDYVEVKERIRFLTEEYEGCHEIETNYTYYEDKRMWVVKATLTLHQKEGKTLRYTGLAQEIESDDYKKVNSTSALENAETSAVGRACGMAGIGIIGSIASADEIKKAQNRAASNGLNHAHNPSTDGLEQSSKSVDELPWLSEEKYYAMLQAIDDGKIDAVKKKMSGYQIKKEYRDILLKAIAELIKN